MPRFNPSRRAGHITVGGGSHELQMAAAALDAVVSRTAWFDLKDLSSLARTLRLTADGNFRSFICQGRADGTWLETDLPTDLIVRCRNLIRDHGTAGGLSGRDFIDALSLQLGMTAVLCAAKVPAHDRFRRALA